MESKITDKTLCEMTSPPLVLGDVIMRALANRKSKDRLFIRNFGEKQNALTLYDDVNGTNYKNTLGI